MPGRTKHLDALPLLRIGRRILAVETVNPYRLAFVEIARRLLWDIDPESWRSRAKMNALRNRYAGKKAVILCNGPSLNRVNFDSLKGTYCFGLNKINLLFSRTDFRPSCIVAVNLLVIEQEEEFFNASEIPLFLNSVARLSVRPSKDRIFFPLTSTLKFARDCSISLHSGATVTFVAMQLAYHMGFSEVALVGCDHHFETSGPPNKRVMGGAVDMNHFDPSYFANQIWQLADLAGSEVCYRMALAAYERAGRRLINATDGGRLEILPRMLLRDFLDS